MAGRFAKTPHGLRKERTEALAKAVFGLMASAMILPLLLIVGYLVVLGATGAGLFGTQPAASGFLVLAGVLTALPLWLFAIAATRLEYGVLGILQYLGPTIQFILGLTVFGQHVGPTYWAGLVFVWCGSAVYLSGALRRSRVELAPR